MLGEWRAPLHPSPTPHPPISPPHSPPSKERLRCSCGDFLPLGLVVTPSRSMLSQLIPDTQDKKGTQWNPRG